MLNTSDAAGCKAMRVQKAGKNTILTREMNNNRSTACKVYVFVRQTISLACLFPWKTQTKKKHSKCSIPNYEALVCDLIIYTSALRKPHKKESNGIKLNGVSGSQFTLPSREMSKPPNRSYRIFNTSYGK